MSIMKQLVIMCSIGILCLIALVYAASTRAETFTVEVNCTKQAEPVVVYPPPVFIGSTVERIIWEEKIRELDAKLRLMNENLRQWRYAGEQ